MQKAGNANRHRLDEHLAELLLLTEIINTGWPSLLICILGKLSLRCAWDRRLKLPQNWGLEKPGGPGCGDNHPSSQGRQQTAPGACQGRFQHFLEEGCAAALKRGWRRLECGMEWKGQSQKHLPCQESHTIVFKNEIVVEAHFSPLSPS